MTETSEGPLYMPSKECWEFVRSHPPAMPTGQPTEDSPIPGMAYYMGDAVGVDRGYETTNEQHVGG